MMETNLFFRQVIPMITSQNTGEEAGPRLDHIHPLPDHTLLRLDHTLRRPGHTLRSPIPILPTPSIPARMLGILLQIRFKTLNLSSTKIQTLNHSPIIF